MPKAEEIDPGFTTADAGNPSITYLTGSLQIRFVDWRELVVTVIFRDVCRFEWTDEPDDYFDGEPDDGTCVVRKSGWVPRGAAANCKHYRINFNASGGRLDVACNSFEVSNEIS
jgi:hypothetical protein